MTLTIRNIIPILNAQFHGDREDAIIDTVSIDSRSLQNSTHTLFFALVGPNHNGHDYLKALLVQGVYNFVVEYIPDGMSGSANFLVVENSLNALHDFAAMYRSNFTFPIIGITGSNGKTIVKEWLNFLLSPDYNIIRSPKSYNSQVGVPLSVLGINEKHNLGIFEAGISTVNEMQHLEKIIRPTIGILTNIGSAHDEGFHDVGEKIKEKLCLFSAVEVLILNKNRSIEAFLSPRVKTFTWSSDAGKADVFIMANEKPDCTELRVTYQKHCFTVTIPFSDQASIENAIHCLMLLLYLRYDEAIIQTRMAQLYPVEMRLKVKNGIHNTRLIDDSYSSDFQSLKIALDFLESQKQYKKKTLILSDIFQSGLVNDDLYAQVSFLTVTNQINRVIAIGPTISNYQRKFPNCLAFPTTAAFLEAMDTLTFEEETILIKGARHFHFEEIVLALEEKTHETVLEINLNAISHNLNFYKSKLNPKTKMMVMVKAFSYGNGGYEIAKLLAHHKVDYLGVAFADEGIALKQAGLELPIMVMNPESTSYQALIQFGLEPEIYSLKGLNAFVKLAEEKQLKNFPIHIKLDTGMHRLGFMEDDLPELIARLQQTQALAVKSILSHLAASDNMAFVDFTLGQIKLFKSLSEQLMEALQIQPIRHLLNTSGISNFGQAQFDMVRLGIGLYGVSNDEEEQKFLEQVATLKSLISQIRVIEPGESVGYSRRFMAERLTRVATVPIGYADGISRHWGNGKGYVTIKDKKAPIIGSICMDMLMVDVTDIDCQEGQEVLLFGKDPSVTYMAKQLGTIPYEIMTSISQRVKRIFYRE
ncbi:bifunctional UDP-N-acetylmuramoyl-tripeptide:D-alanyl-D-alanine ligase/alanine racemase [Flavobacterium sp.]|uniref:bifunctional UDP-N-acetylmuramoyl-tripeptide:D-alanyl-D-alanine ligase/alanine racemase n=1 Tax=Flavobacterium sp. TaxID=239 RepID=UPI00261B8717|nr:bifunctional UDP-N-acetylmuramoyl-tripeptide:D-alanyl-D-alanine ligase/alanine racemase [Flavobacterium sp.]